MIGGSTKVRFVGAQEIEHGRQDRRIAQPGPQRIGGHAGQGQQPFGARTIRQHPTERSKRQGVRVVRGFGVAKNCRPLA